MQGADCKLGLYINFKSSNILQLLMPALVEGSEGEGNNGSATTVEITNATKLFLVIKDLLPGAE